LVNELFITLIESFEQEILPKETLKFLSYLSTETHLQPFLITLLDHYKNTLKDMKLSPEPEFDVKNPLNYLKNEFPSQKSILALFLICLSRIQFSNSSQKGTYPTLTLFSVQKLPIPSEITSFLDVFLTHLFYTLFISPELEEPTIQILSEIIHSMLSYLKFYFSEHEEITEENKKT
jgi:hypothetical protein